jgi:hypothetical protein
MSFRYSLPSTELRLPGDRLQWTSRQELPKTASVDSYINVTGVRQDITLLNLNSLPEHSHLACWTICADREQSFSTSTDYTRSPLIRVHSLCPGGT